jgi:hypothetical protein
LALQSRGAFVVAGSAAQHSQHLKTCSNCMKTGADANAIALAMKRAGTDLMTEDALVRGLRLACAAALLLAAVACRSSDVGEGGGAPIETVVAEQPETAAVQTPEGAGQPDQTYGKGEARVTLLLHLTGELADEKLNQSLINGARLAVEDLGPNDLTLVVHDTRSNVVLVAAGVVATRNAQLVIVPGDNAAIASAIARIPKGETPIIALGSYEQAMSSGAYWFMPSWIDELAQATEYASRTFKKKLRVVILEPNGADTRLTQMLTKKLSKVAEKVDTVRHGLEAEAARISSDDRKALDLADAVVIMESDAAVAPFVDQLRQMEFSNGQKFFIVRGDVAKQLSSEPAFSGAIAAVPDFGNFDIVSNRYRQIHSGTMSVEAAYTYDAVAAAAGIVRASGGSDITRPMLETKTGFDGAAGSFRFHTDGQVERKYNIVRLGKEDLVILETAPDEF